MHPGSYALQLYRGDSYRWQFTLYDDLPQTMPTDLTGVSVAAQIRDKPGGVYICALSCTIVLPNVVNGFLSSDDCAKLPGSAAWDLQLLYASGDVLTVLAGPVIVTPDVTDLSAPTPAPLRFVRGRRNLARVPA